MNTNSGEPPDVVESSPPTPPPTAADPWVPDPIEPKIALQRALIMSGIYVAWILATTWGPVVLSPLISTVNQDWSSVLLLIMLVGLLGFITPVVLLVTVGRRLRRERRTMDSAGIGWYPKDLWWGLLIGVGTLALCGGVTSLLGYTTWTDVSREDTLLLMPVVIAASGALYTFPLAAVFIGYVWTNLRDGYGLRTGSGLTLALMLAANFLCYGWDWVPALLRGDAFKTPGDIALMYAPLVATTVCLVLARMIRRPGSLLLAVGLVSCQAVGFGASNISLGWLGMVLAIINRMRVDRTTGATSTYLIVTFVVTLAVLIPWLLLDARRPVTTISPPNQP